MDSERAAAKIEDQFHKMVRKDRDIHIAHYTVWSPSKDFKLKLSDAEEGIYHHPDQPQFTASVSKMLTSTLLAVLEEEGKVSYDDPISMYLDDDVLKGLHVLDGVDHSQGILVRHLLNHTSGLHDYFEEGSSIKKMELKVVMDDPDRFWDPRELIEISKQISPPRFKPGGGFYYSSTGYQILGLIIEEITSMPYHEVISSRFFRPLDMRSAYLIQRSTPIEASPHPVAGVYLGDENVVGYRSLSEEYAAGGMVCSAEDACRFIRAFAAGEIISPDAYSKMQDWAKFGLNLDYGYGLMRFKSLPLLMPFEMLGHAGATGTFMLWEPRTMTFHVGGVHQHAKHSKAIRMAMMGQSLVGKIPGVSR